MRRSDWIGASDALRVDADRGQGGRWNPWSRQRIGKDAECQARERHALEIVRPLREDVSHHGGGQRERAQPVRKHDRGHSERGKNVEHRPAPCDRGVERHDGDRQQRHGSYMGTFAVLQQRLQPSRPEDSAHVVAGREKQQSRWREKRISQAARETGPQTSREPVRHPEQSHRARAVEKCGHEVVRVRR